MTPFEFLTIRDNDPEHDQRLCSGDSCAYLYEIEVIGVDPRLCRFCLARLRATLKIAEAGLPKRERRSVTPRDGE